MTLTMADSITPANLPGGYDSYLGYVDGSWPTAPVLRSKFPGKPVVSLTVLGGDHLADGCDIEHGDLSPGQSGPAWLAWRVSAGQHRPIGYASISDMPTVLAELARLKVARASVRLLSAHYGAGEHICGPSTCKYPGVTTPMDGTQWTDSAPGNGGTRIDASLLQGDFFGTQEAGVIITTTPPGDWEGAVIVLGKGTDGNIWLTRTDDGKAWTVPVKQ